VQNRVRGGHAYVVFGDAWRIHGGGVRTFVGVRVGGEVVVGLWLWL